MGYMLLRKRKISRSQFELIGSFLLVLVGLIVTIVTPMIKLNTSIVKLTDAV